MTLYSLGSPCNRTQADSRNDVHSRSTVHSTTTTSIAIMQRWIERTKTNQFINKRHEYSEFVVVTPYGRNHSHNRPVGKTKIRALINRELQLIHLCDVSHMWNDCSFKLTCHYTMHLLRKTDMSMITQDKTMGYISWNEIVELSSSQLPFLTSSLANPEPSLGVQPRSPSRSERA